MPWCVPGALNLKANLFVAGEAAIRDVKKRSFLINSCKFCIDARYVPIKPIGKGAYGVVWYACAVPVKQADVYVLSMLFFLLCLFFQLC